MKWIKDHEFIRGKCPMTKFETRVVTIGFLEIDKEDQLLDVGAGTGSVSIEAALHGAEVISLERNEEGIRLIQQNSDKFKVKLNIIHGNAPAGLEQVKVFNKCFIGGSGGNLKELFQKVDEKMSTNGIVVANFVTLKNLHSFQNLLTQYKYKNIEVRMLQSSIMDDRTGILKANNPVFLVKGEKR